jgi:NAD(P)-dependent dehydrogenase (short-subunit alcohol dehydrogenase family)
MGAAERVVVITGAAGNLGRAVARAFAAAGDKLVLVDRRLDALAAAFGEAGDTRLYAAVNLLDAGEANALAKAAQERFGRIDALCNIAGGFRMGEPVHATSDENWDFLMDLNARTVLHMARAVVPHMLARGSGKIVNVAAFAAQKGAANMGAYTASKALVIRLTEAMAAELRAKGINVNCVMPTIIDTPENRKSMPDADPRQWVAPEDLANVIEFLASPRARAIHGAAIPVTGLV